MTTLSNEDKISIIVQHKRNIEYSKYNTQLSIIEENAITSPNQETIKTLNDQIIEFDKKINALDKELDLIPKEVEE